MIKQETKRRNERLKNSKIVSYDELDKIIFTALVVKEFSANKKMLSSLKRKYKKEIKALDKRFDIREVFDEAIKLDKRKRI